MARTEMKTAAWILLAIVAGGTGYAAGSRQGHQAMMTRLQIEAGGNLTQRIEALSLLRIGDVPAAIESASVPHIGDDMKTNATIAVPIATASGSGSMRASTS
jgi:hypothetical protein